MEGSGDATYVLPINLSLPSVLFFELGKNESVNEVQSIEVIFSYPSYKVHKLRMNSLTLSSTTVRPMSSYIGITQSTLQLLLEWVVLLWVLVWVVQWE